MDIFKFLCELAQIPGQTARAEALREQIHLRDRQIGDLERERDTLRSKVASLTKEFADLREQYASAQLDTEEFEEGGVIWRRTPAGKSGPYCPIHRDVRLSKPSPRLGWYCSECRVPITEG